MKAIADNAEALRQTQEYMFGPKLLISPVTEAGVSGTVIGLYNTSANE